MALSDAMLADAIKDFLNRNSEDFEKFLSERYEVDTAVHFGGEAVDAKRVTVHIKVLGQDGSPTSERIYALHIETISRPPGRDSA
jgi:hypothetical protein